MNYITVALPVPLFREFDYACPDPVEPGARVRVPFGRTECVGYVTSVSGREPSSEYPLKSVNAVLDPESLLTPPLMELSGRMSRYYVCGPGEIYSAVLPASVRGRSRKKDPVENLQGKETAFLLSAEQSAVLEPVIKKIDERESGRFLLYGVSDSGKTEVYMHIAAALADMGRQTLLLVPEIAITAQLVDRFSRRFGRKRLGVWHSRISSGQKMGIARDVRNGKLDILIGPRSAVFAPFRDLGSVIIDEEHDSSYKNPSIPYYDARWVAEQRCCIENAVLILGSATPRVETLYRCSKKDIARLDMDRKIHQQDRPELFVVDMKQEISERPRNRIFSRFLLDKMAGALKKGDQIILLINRKGYSTSVICKNCGENIKCPECDIPMVYHSYESRLVCHWCDYSTEPFVKCSKCGGEIYRYAGIGVERVERALRKIFPDTSVVRMDTETTSKKGSAERIFERFGNKVYDIMIGTQMVAKGWDFPGVSLVGVINSDIGLLQPDFRASEKTYAMLKQVEGRAGRGDSRGTVIFQSYSPSHYGIKLLFEDDYDNFYSQEIAIRKDTEFPPFKRLINMVSEHKNGKTAETNLRKCYNLIKEKLPETDILGPARAPRYKYRGKFRWQMLIKYADENIKDTIKDIIMENRFAGKLKVDVDPQDML